MKWGRKKSPSPSTHCQSLITRVFPVSWLVKFKQNGVSFEPNSAQKKQKSKLNSPSSRSYQCANWKEGRFCNMEDDDVYWKLLFEEERIKARKSSRGMNSVQYYSDDELGFPTENNQQFNDMALHTRKMKEIQHEMRNTWENHASRKKKATYKTPKRKARKDRKSKNLEAKREENERGSDEEKSDENDIYEIAMESGVVHMEEKDFVKPAAFNSRKQHGFFCPRPSSSARKFVEECTSDDLNLEESNANSQEDHFSMDRQLQCEDKKIKDYLISRMEPRRKSAYISRTKQKVKVYSSRTECKIRGLEDIKKARMKSKKKTRERGAEVEGSRVFDNFAVVKCSFAPERDFRDSMVEMIREKGIRRPDELEDLLACYLTLNCDKYHDLIIKAFQQVWLFELNQEFINLEIGKDHLSCDK